MAAIIKSELAVDAAGAAVLDSSERKFRVDAVQVGFIEGKSLN
jgi:hypothetical protein